MSGLEFLPEMGLVAGAGVGTGLDLFAQRYLAKRNQNVIEQTGIIADQPTGRRRIGRAILSTTMAVGSIGGYWIGQSFSTEQSGVSIEPSLTVVVDHSAPTDDGETPPLAAINAVVDAIAAHDIESRALVASSSQVDGMETDEVRDHTPFGDAPLGAAVQDAMLGAVTIRERSAVESKQSSLGIVVVTAGNGIGDPGQVIRDARLIGSPISVVNVESSIVDPAVTEQLKAVASETGGTYWDVAAVEGETVAETVTETLVSQQAEPTETSGSMQDRLFAVASTIVGLAIAMHRRRNETIINGLDVKGDT